MAMAACTSDTSAPVDPDRELLDSALEVERDLLDAVAGGDTPAEASAQDAVREHIAALEQALGQSAALSTSPSVMAPPARAADRAANAHTRALRTASAPISPLLAAIAASDAAIAATLRSSA
jgi:hypothetical protein